MSRFGRKLRALRRHAGLSQQALASELGYQSHSYLSEVERGWKEPGISLAIAVADRFEVSLDALLRDNIRLNCEDD